MVFCQTKRACDQVSIALTERGFAAATVHGDLGQAQRERALRAFRTGKVDVLVATDVAARGIDVDDVTHVINYECPDDAMAYVHRIGRTGRAGRTGVAVTFVDWRDLHRWKLISEGLGLGQPEPAETYSTSEHLFTDLGIPPGVTGTLPRELRGARAGLAAEVEEDLGETGKTRSQAPRSQASSRSRGRSRGGRSGDDRPARGGGQETTTAKAADDSAAAAATPRPRRRRTRGGRDLGTEAAAGS
jgi:superfamily II DNA/RNA helicase